MTDPIETTNQPTRDALVNPTPKKKLIETSLPLEIINRETEREAKIRQSKPATFHHWWARRPHVNTRAVLFAQLVDDPSANPDMFPTAEAQATERARLHRLLEELCVWENSSDPALLAEARKAIRQSNGGRMPAILDPFAGGGTIPLEAQRLGLEAHASDLNPVAVMINRALVEIPPRFAGRAPVSPSAAGQVTGWTGTQGIAEDVAQYGEWLRAEGERRLGHMYPKIKSPDGTEHTVVAWIWARTVRSPNPANPIETPLISSWTLSKKRGREKHLEPRVTEGGIRYEVADGRAPASDGTVGRRGGASVADGTPFSLAYVRDEGRAGRIGRHLVAIAADGDRGRVYFNASADQLAAAEVDAPEGVLDMEIGIYPRDIKTQTYGMHRWADLYTNRQLTMLSTLSELVGEARARVLDDCRKAGWPEGTSFEQGGTGAVAYADAVATYLAAAVDKLADLNNSLCRWEPQAECPRNLFNRQAIPMVWDYAESNPFSTSSGSLAVILRGFKNAFAGYGFSLGDTPAGEIRQADAASRTYTGLAVSTDPPYYDNIGYSDLSDFFYVWLRRSIGEFFPATLGTLLTPKSEELVANPHRHGDAKHAAEFFVKGFNRVFERIRETANTEIPLTVYYAYKQQDAEAEGSASTGWHTLLDGLISSGWEVTATWPMRTEGGGRMMSHGLNVLASSIVLACRPRPADATATTRRAFVAALKAELPRSLQTLMQGTIAPVDLAQAAIGPGVSVFSRYARVREADGSDMSVKDALLLVNATLDEVIGEQESDFDPDTRFAVKWYRQYGWKQESSGIADQLARSSDTSIGALERGGIFEAKGGKARLLSPTQLEDAWDVSADERVSVWEATIRLAAVMAKHGVDRVAEMLPSVQTRVNLDAVKELGFLLFHEAEKKRDTKDAILFNGLVSAWGDVNEQARKHAGSPRAVQQAFDFDEDGD
ncbi:DUF1156 domain-containing protein [Microbacterium sp. HA-8]|uniref:DUF1156 domain-containing protein n=1 Tax=Microbacterium sp. HA-8 TaxID=3234200 RepID=UPI0038F78EB6